MFEFFSSPVFVCCMKIFCLQGSSNSLTRSNDHFSCLNEGSFIFLTLLTSLNKSQKHSFEEKKPQENLWNALSLRVEFWFTIKYISFPFEENFHSHITENVLFDQLLYPLTYFSHGRKGLLASSRHTYREMCLWNYC